MAMGIVDSIKHWMRRIERADDEDTKLAYMRKLSKIPVDKDMLKETGAGKFMRKLSKTTDAVGLKADSILKKWRDVCTNNEKAKLENSKCISSSKKENVLKKSSSNSNKPSTKHDAAYQSYQNKMSHVEHKHKVKSEGLGSHEIQSSSKKYLNGDIPTSMSKESSPSIYTYVKQESQAKYMDYDPHADINEGYNPECPELYPSNKSHKVKKSQSVIDSYEPSSVKRKSSSKEATKETDKRHKFKKPKIENGSSESSHTVKKEKYDVHKDKGKASKSSTSVIPKTESSDKKISASDSSKQNKKLASESKTSKSKDSSGKKSLSSSISKGKIKINCAEEFTSSEVRFEDCLNFNDIVTVKKKKTVKSHTQSTNIKSSTSKSSSSSHKPHSSSSKTTISSSISKEVKTSHKSGNREKLRVDVPKPAVKLEEVDIVSTLPQTMPTYRPLPQPRSPESFSSKKKTVLTNEEAIKFTSSRREKTAVYSGRKSYFTEVPTLFDICTQKLIENVDAIDRLGVPYFLIKAVLVKCTPQQLYNIEHYNPTLLEDTHELWEVHCKRDYKLLTPEESETWRELYWRAHDEREQKLRSITANISASISKSNPVRQVKLAYVDSFAKPPRDVARRQAKHGTALPVNHPVKTGPPSKASPKPTAPVINASAISVSTPAVNPKAKPKVAPLMAKTLKSMKMCFRR